MVGISIMISFLIGYFIGYHDKKPNTNNEFETL